MSQSAEFDATYNEVRRLVGEGKYGAAVEELTMFGDNPYASAYATALICQRMHRERVSAFVDELAQACIEVAAVQS